MAHSRNSMYAFQSIERISCHPLEPKKHGRSTEETRRIAVDDVVLYQGSPGDLGPIVRWGLDMEWSVIRAREKMTTNLPGIFVSGDTAYYPDKPSQYSRTLRMSRQRTCRKVRLLAFAPRAAPGARRLAAGRWLVGAEALQPLGLFLLLRCQQAV